MSSVATEGGITRSPEPPDKLSDGPQVVIVSDMLLNSATEYEIADVKLTSNFAAHISLRKEPTSTVDWCLPHVFQSIIRDEYLCNLSTFRSRGFC